MNIAGPFEVRFADSALDDLERLFDFLFEGARTAEDLDTAQQAIDEIEATCSGHLSKTPFSYRKSGRGALRRELIIPFGSTGYVVQYEIVAGHRPCRSTPARGRLPLTLAGTAAAKLLDEPIRRRHRRISSP